MRRRRTGTAKFLPDGRVNVRGFARRDTRGQRGVYWGDEERREDPDPRWAEGEVYDEAYGPPNPHRGRTPDDWAVDVAIDAVELRVAWVQEAEHRQQCRERADVLDQQRREREQRERDERRDQGLREMRHVHEWEHRGGVSFADVIPIPAQRPRSEADRLALDIVRLRRESERALAEAGRLAAECAAAEERLRALLGQDSLMFHVKL